MTVLRAVIDVTLKLYKHPTKLLQRSSAKLSIFGKKIALINLPSRPLPQITRIGSLCSNRL